MRCLEDERSKRYQNVTELRLALEDALHHYGPATRTSSVRRLETVRSLLSIATSRGLRLRAADSADGVDVINIVSPGDTSGASAIADAADHTAGVAAADAQPDTALSSIRVGHFPASPDLGIQGGVELQVRERRRTPPRVRPVPSVWALVLLSALVLLLSTLVISALAPRGTLSIALAPFTSFNAFGSSQAPSISTGKGGSQGASAAGAGGASPVNGASAGSSSPAPQTSTKTASPGSSPSPGSAPPPAPTATPGPPSLLVSPISITLTACLAITKTQFTIANTGGTSTSWTASATGTGYQISPASGGIAAGGQVTVTVSSILVSGSVTVSAPAAQHSPQHVSITCTV
jgi:hypothetical protein